MRRIFLIGGMAVWFLSCSNNGNDASGNDTASSNVNQASPYTTDTVTTGIGAGANPSTADSGTGGGAMLSDSTKTPGTGIGKDTANKQR